MHDIENKLINLFVIGLLHATSITYRCYLLFNRKLRKRFVLLDEMKGIDPLIYPSSGNLGYVVRGTSLTIAPRMTAVTWENPKAQIIENKYDVYMSVPGEPWEKKVDLEYIMDNYSNKVNEKFIFNINKFK